MVSLSIDISIFYKYRVSTPADKTGKYAFQQASDGKTGIFMHFFFVFEKPRCFVFELFLHHKITFFFISY